MTQAIALKREAPHGINYSVAFIFSPLSRKQSVWYRKGWHERFQLGIWVVLQGYGYPELRYKTHRQTLRQRKLVLSFSTERAYDTGSCDAKLSNPVFWLSCTTTSGLDTQKCSISAEKRIKRKKPQITHQESLFCHPAKTIWPSSRFLMESLSSRPQNTRTLQWKQWGMPSSVINHWVMQNNPTWKA